MWKRRKRQGMLLLHRFLIWRNILWTLLYTCLYWMGQRILLDKRQIQQRWRFCYMGEPQRWILISVAIYVRGLKSRDARVVWRRAILKILDDVPPCCYDCPISFGPSHSKVCWSPLLLILFHDNLPCTQSGPIHFVYHWLLYGRSLFHRARLIHVKAYITGYRGTKDLSVDCRSIDNMGWWLCALGMDRTRLLYFLAYIPLPNLGCLLEILLCSKENMVKEPNLRL